TRLGPCTYQLAAEFGFIGGCLRWLQADVADPEGRALGLAARMPQAVCDSCLGFSASIRMLPPDATKQEARMILIGPRWPILALAAILPMLGHGAFAQD